MTDNQYFGMIQMILSIIKRCKTREEMIEAVEELMEGPPQRTNNQKNKNG